MMDRSLGPFLEPLDHRYPSDPDNFDDVFYADKRAIVQAEDNNERIDAKEKKKKKQYALILQKNEEDILKTHSQLKEAQKALQDAEAKQIEAEHLQLVKHRRQEERAKDAMNPRPQLEEWLDNHGITFHMAPLNGDDSGTQQADELLIYISKVDLNSPTRNFIISMEFLSVEHTKFKVRSVTPVFDEAYDLIQKANTDQDLKKLMIECKRYWLRDCTDNSSGLPPERTTGDHTEPLFDSPSSTLSEIAHENTVQVTV